MGLDALLQKLESRSVTVVTASETGSVTAATARALGCTAVTLVTGQNRSKEQAEGREISQGVMHDPPAPMTEPEMEPDPGGTDPVTVKWDWFEPADNEENIVTVPQISNTSRHVEYDDRRRCDQCANLTEHGSCLAAMRGEINSSRIYSPVPDLPQRCVGYLPMATEADQRHGRARWPGLT